MHISAVIFDVDGTLVDSNLQHVQAWGTALERHGYRVEESRIREHIGKGGDNFVPGLLGRDAAARDGDSLRRAHTEEYQRLLQLDPPALFSQVRELLTALRRRGVMAVIATSNTRRQFEAARAAIRGGGPVLSDLVDRLVTADDADRSKPAPDLVEAAVRGAGVRPSACVMVGDTPWDVRASVQAGVRCVGLLCGRCHDERQLTEAGAAAVYRDPAELLERLDEVLRHA